MEFKSKISSFKQDYTHLYAAFGRLDRSEPIFVFSDFADENRWFDLSSLTKALITVPLIYKYMDDFKYSIRDLLPQNSFSSCFQNIKIKELLSHRSGLPFWANFWVNQYASNGENHLYDSDSKLKHLDNVLARQVLRNDKTYVYSDVGYLFLQRILELVTHRSFFDLFKAELKTLSQEFDFNLYKNTLNKAIPTGYCALRRRLIKGEVHDENAAVLGGFCGHSGAFATGEGLTVYLKGLLLTHVGQRILDEQLKIIKNDDASPALLGWWKGNIASTGGFFDGCTIGHLGFTGTAFWVDPKSLHYGILLTNRVIKGRISNRIQLLRAEVFSFFDKLRK